jgi:hypothetical protein
MFITIFVVHYIALESFNFCESEIALLPDKSLLELLIAAKNGILCWFMLSQSLNSPSTCSKENLEALPGNQRSGVSASNLIITNCIYLEQNTVYTLNTIIEFIKRHCCMYFRTLTVCCILKIFSRSFCKCYCYLCFLILSA